MASRSQAELGCTDDDVLTSAVSDGVADEVSTLSAQLGLARPESGSSAQLGQTLFCCRILISTTDLGRARPSEVSAVAHLRHGMSECRRSVSAVAHEVSAVAHLRHGMSECRRSVSAVAHLRHGMSECRRSVSAVAHLRHGADVDDDEVRVDRQNRAEGAAEQLGEGGTVSAKTVSVMTVSVMTDSDDCIGDDCQ